MSTSVHTGEVPSRLGDNDLDGVFNMEKKMNRKSKDLTDVPKEMKNETLFSLSELPPNTGPPQKLLSEQGGASGVAHKNLSHVPCKFYKQGVCQAGDSCPFSHNVEGSSAADKLPCKYFQKGYCKFGLKCALAHYLPDGTRINVKGIILQRNFARGNEDQDNNSSAITGGGPNRRSSNSMGTMGNGLAQAIEISGATPHVAMEGKPSAYSPSKAFGSIKLVNRYSPLFETTGTDKLLSTFGGPMSFNPLVSNQSGQKYNQTLLNSFGPHNVQNLSGKSYSTNTPPPLAIFEMHSSQNGFASANSSMNHSPAGYNANSLSIVPPFSMGRLTLSSFSSPPNFSNSVLNESAIVDDNDDDMDDNSGFFEDYVPGSLGDSVLTPQEMQRRDSRSQSGTLLVREPSFIQKNCEETTSHICGINTTGNISKTDIQKNSQQEGVFVME